MKRKRINMLANVGLAITLAVLMASCASAGYRKSEKTASSLQDSAKDIERAAAQVQLAVTALDDLVNNPRPDLRSQFKKFSKAAERAASLAERIREADKELQEHGDSVFENWDKQLVSIQNEDILTRGQKRKQEVVEKYQAVRATCMKTLSEYEPLLSSLNDVRRFLSSDLTPGGLDAIKDATTRVKQLAGPAQDAVNNLVADMRKLATDISPQLVAAK